MTTRVYLDVDGVINSFSRTPPKRFTGWYGTWRQKIATVEESKYVILWSEELVHEINLLSEREDVEFAFLTTWQDSATTIFSPLVGLNSLYWDVLHPEHEDDIEDVVNWWKLDTLKKDLKNKKYDKVVWVDDDISFDPKTLQWLQTAHEQILTICPTSIYGVTKKEIDAIIKFINK